MPSRADVTTTTCRRCGASIAPAAAFCSHCGEARPRRNTNRTIVVASVAALIALLALGAAVVLAGRAPERADDEVRSERSADGATTSLPPVDALEAPASTASITTAAPSTLTAPSSSTAPATIAVTSPPAAEIATIPPATVVLVAPTQPPAPPPAEAPDSIEYVDEPTTGSLHLGHRGPRTLSVQNMLVGLGYDVDTDGYFGPGTRSAVIDFQRSEGLEADGLVGARTMEILVIAVEAMDCCDY